MDELEGVGLRTQAAQILGISVKTLYRNSYAYDDFPHPTKVGHTVLYDPDALRAWRYEHPSRQRAN